MTYTLKYDVLRTVIVLQALYRPSILQVLRALKYPTARALPMIWKQTQKTWDSGRPWLMASKQNSEWYVCATCHGAEVFHGWKTRPTIIETNERAWIDAVRSGWLDVENAAIPKPEQHHVNLQGLNYLAICAKQVGCQMHELFELLNSGELRVCTAPGCEQRLKRSSEFSPVRHTRCKKCRAREKREKNE